MLPVARSDGWCPSSYMAPHPPGAGKQMTWSSPCSGHAKPAHVPFPAHMCPLCSGMLQLMGLMGDGMVWLMGHWDALVVRYWDAPADRVCC